ncbi:MAG: UDP-N-acetylglucosamine 2-epimerase (non-hydrolyzing) [Bacteroidota bacterium]
MIKILTIIGTRPQIIKAAAISRAISSNFPTRIKEYILHTGQHYDEKMSEVFFNELKIPKPDFHLHVGSGSHGTQTAKMIEGIEHVLTELNPDYLLVYGDTNSTLAGAIAASKIHIPIIHVEAGLRSFIKSMPEEINRIMCDHVSTLLFSPTITGIENLKNEGLLTRNQPPYTIDNPKVYHSGDVMYDNSLHFAEFAKSNSTILTQLSIQSNQFILCTIHRGNNTDYPERLNAIFAALESIAEQSNQKIILPLHPRTKKMLASSLNKELFIRIDANTNIIITEPVSFLDMIQLEANSSLIITDSGGVQKEAYFFHKPCVIIRPETEWTELVKNGTAILADADTKKIIFSFKTLFNNTELVFNPIFGDGKAADFICNKIIEHAENNRYDNTRAKSSSTQIHKTT